jgi:hypothetical protein
VKEGSLVVQERMAALLYNNLVATFTLPAPYKAVVPSLAIKLVDEVKQLEH